MYARGLKFALFQGNKMHLKNSFKILQPISVFSIKNNNLINSNQKSFSSQQQVQANDQTFGMDDIELQAYNIQQQIDKSNKIINNITRKGMGLSKEISKDVQQDQFIKMQRYNIFIAKMEELQKSEKNWKKQENKVMLQMTNAFMNSSKPLRDVLFYYNKAAVKGFNSSLVANTLDMIKKNLRARGNIERPYEDYSTRDFDISWRMQMLSSHLKSGLEKNMHFNHYYLGQSSRLIADIGFKDSELIQKFFDKLNFMIDEKEQKKSQQNASLNYEEILYGSFLNFMPRHYIFDGFQSNEEFRQHLRTLLEWDTKKTDVLNNLGIEASPSVQELEVSLAQLLESVNLIKHFQVNIQASIDSLRQQLFKLQEAHDKHAWLQENKFVHLELLELQELLVKGGYIKTEEALNSNSQQTFKLRMERASAIFYDYVQNFAPELISTQYKDFFQAADDTIQKRSQHKQLINLDEKHDQISLSSLSQALTGLYRQSLSYRKDSLGNDYLHKFYEDHANQGENQPKNIEDVFQDEQLQSITQHLESSYVKMERDYLKAYSVFDREVEKIWPRLKKMIQNNKLNDLEGQLYALLALSSCKIEDQNIRQLLISQINQNIKSRQKARPQALIDGINGIALQYEITKEQQQTAGKLLDILYKQMGKQSDQKLSFDQKIDILWAACALQLENQNKLIKDLYLDIHSLNFQRTNNDLTFEQFQKVRDFLLYMTEASSVKNEEWVKNDQNGYLEFLSRSPQLHEQRYEESKANFDPFKKRVLLAVGRGLSTAGIDYQISLENNLVAQGEQDTEFNDNLYPYKPDLIFGYNGQKVLLSVIKQSQTMRDIKKPDGHVQFRQRILEQLNKDFQQVKSVCVPITSIVKYDIQNLKIQMNSEYDFIKEIKNQINNFEDRGINFENLSQFGAQISKEAYQNLGSIKNSQDRQRLCQFLKQLFKLFQIKQETEKQYRIEVYQLGVNKTKFELMKLNILYQSMPQHQQSFINQFVPSQIKNFQEMIIKQKQILEKVKIEKNNDQVDEQIDQKWIGIRQEVELPQIQTMKLKKSIVPEFINQKFMWYDDYFHYEDWKQQLKKVFSNFDLLVIPRKENDYKYFYNRGQNQRIVPQGIFPNSVQKRQLLLPNYDNFAAQLSESSEKGNDVLNQFEKDPFKIMILSEIKKSNDLLPLSQEISFMTNLQNLKQGFKQDYKDKEILDTILLKSEFTEKLIEEHLQLQNQNQQSNTQFLDRDPSAYRQFVQSTYYSKDQEDPFTHFYLKEAGKIERVHNLYNDKKKEYEDFIQQNPQSYVKERTQELFKSLHQKVEDMLLENHLENDDNLSLSHQMDIKINLEYNIKSLMKSEFVYDVDPDLQNPNMSDFAYLELQRKRAETKLIKSKIIYKQHHDLDLSENERKYLKTWVSQIQNENNVNIFNLRDQMVPKQYSRLSIADSLSAEDIYALNSVPKVNIDRERHENFALNDLVLELSHFLDEEVVNRVEMQLISMRIKKEWGLPQNFQILETRNKEISLVLNELEELAWRMAGGFNQKDIDALKAVFSIQRNQDHFDKQFYQNDIDSMNQFLQVSNFFDQRIKLLEEWVVRKEEEIKSRQNIPPKHLQLTDQEIYQKIQSKQIKAREKLVADLFQEDENQQQKTKKNYKDLTTQDLGKISESLVSKLYLFQGEYPLFLPAVIKGIMEHPNISKSDYSLIDSYMEIFEIDWRGDKSVKNKKEFLATNPIYLNFNDSKTNFEGYGQVGNIEATAMIQQACIPYVESLAEGLVKQASQ